MLEIRNLSKIYNRRDKSFIALNDVSFKIDKGEFCAVVGPSGAGKSTLLHIIGGLTHPDSGSVKFKGAEIYNQPAKELDNYRKKHLGFMFQQFFLMPYLTVRENIRLACYEKEHFMRIDYFLDKCSLAPMAKKYPSELSVGEKQRTAFIRAIIAMPEVLLADEPTGNLDPGNSEILMTLINEYHEKNGTVILVTHDPLLSRFADQKIDLKDGAIRKQNSAS
jgi:putative ABC transport system ATP-binding protein